MIKGTVTFPSGIDNKDFVVLGKTGFKLCFSPVFFDRLVFPHTARGHERPFGPFTKGGIPIQSFL